jgi:hypothetical protein
MKSPTLARLALALSLISGAAGCDDDNTSDEPGDASAEAAHASNDAAATIADAGSPLADSGSTGSATDRALQEMTIAKLKTCGAFEPSADPSTYAIEDEFDRCIGRCLLTASCSEFKALACDEDENALARCADKCPDPPADGFRCNDGSRIAHAALCDLFDDCESGEDELNCGQYRCKNGEIVPAKSARCDSNLDCEDGTDESGCSFVCP